MLIVKKLTVEDIPSIDRCGDVKNILVRAEVAILGNAVGDIGIIVWEYWRARHCYTRRWTIRFANGNQGMDYPDLHYMLEREMTDGLFSFYLLEIK